ncbi:MAG: CoA-transferase [Halioglobus sp.]
MTASKVVSAEAAVDLIADGDTVGILGCIGWVTPDAVLKALSERFEKTRAPRDLTAFCPVGTGDMREILGIDHIAKEGLLKRAICGSWLNARSPITGERPELFRMLRGNLLECYAWPMGAMMHWLREVARHSPGYLTSVGIGTYADPRLDGTRLNDCTPEGLVRVVEFEGEEQLFYPTWPVNVAIIRATSADEMGNLSFENEPLISSAIALALAAKASGGIVIAQVKHLCEPGRRRTQDCRFPGAYVDRVVVADTQTMGTYMVHDQRFLGGIPFDKASLATMPEGLDKVLQRRAMAEVEKHVVTIFGYGLATCIPLVMAEEGLLNEHSLHEYLFTTEHGPYGGVVMPGAYFSPNIYADALFDGPTQFDAIDGGLCKTAFLSFGQFDAQGNINVSRLGDTIVGAGGFIDIAHNAEKLVLVGTFTAGGLEADVEDGMLSIRQEGRARKFVERAEHITYPALQGVRQRGQQVKIITERATFELRENGLLLTEIAAGVDLQKDILDQMAYPPAAIADPLPRSTLPSTRAATEAQS